MKRLLPIPWSAPVVLALLALALGELAKGNSNYDARPTVSPISRGHWITLNDCLYLYNRSDDGDSFHVSAGGHEYIFRLYFVDAPETNLMIRARAREQAKYFRITEDQTIAVGKLAQTYTRELLTGPFTARTCFQDALGRSRLERYYAIVQTKTGDLAEQLVENGLARLHGASANPLGLPSANVEWQKLRQLESAAKIERVGAWGASVGRLNVRSQKSFNRAPLDPFDAFFHPEKTRTAAPPSSSPASGKLDLNSATKAQLQELPGVGPTLAQRIIAARPFQNADELARVNGIGEIRFARLRPYFQ